MHWVSGQTKPPERNLGVFLQVIEAHPLKSQAFKKIIAIYDGNLLCLLSFLKQSTLKVRPFFPLHIFGELLLNDLQNFILEFSCLQFVVCLASPSSAFIAFCDPFK